jgi:hypothetical protein
LIADIYIVDTGEINVLICNENGKKSFGEAKIVGDKYKI